MLKLLLEGGYEILLKETWQSYSDALHENDGDPLKWNRRKTDEKEWTKNSGRGDGIILFERIKRPGMGSRKHN